ncbi:hypothetical protein CHLNCDRAFT_137557 [Chlorella variabilis]|uniref:Uncharacterized protein n=1 Tax=Chlorella variabilis TaxID=554065 RepID=E1Z3Y7_CHLVA|nr:hypothetical protein CHLNCDRAFT_137557 [Chlorella variabilis]EFN59257.1 hypothetical protein CHLNCDRAFT_137557 [Chlorella variabilis]|eukprot:XP_005851359.1 hypothetical protein CHLNCDRAFT_137557 [Chlorella variabilis]
MAEAAGAGGISAWQLLVSSATPTIIVCLLGAVGAAMARKGVLDGPGCQVLAQMCFFVFTPALTFSKVAQAVSLASLTRLWPLLANMTASAVFYRTLGEDCEHLGIAYTAFDIAAATLWQFTLAINLIRRGRAAAEAAAAAGGNPVVDGDAAAGAAAGQLLPVSSELRKMPTLSDLLKGRGGSRLGSAASSRPGSADSSPRDHELLLAPDKPTGGSALAPAVCGTAAVGPQGRSAQQQQQQQHGSVLVELQPTPGAAGPGHPARWQPPPLEQRQQPQWQAHDSAQDASPEEDDTAALLRHESGAGWSSSSRGGKAALDAAAGEGRHAGGGGAVGAGHGWLGRTSTSAWRYLRGVDWAALFPLPSQAAILGIVCGCIPAVKGLLYSPHPPLRMLSEALDALGTGLIPTAIPLLGAVLYRQAGSPAVVWGSQAGRLAGTLAPSVSRLPRRVTLAALCLKLVIQPALLTLLVTLMVLYQHGEAEMSTLLQWQYLASVLTLPAFMWAFLRIIAAWL